MRALLAGLAVAVVMTLSGGVQAHGYYDYMQSLRWYCYNGDYHACRRLHHEEWRSRAWQEQRWQERQGYGGPRWGYPG